MYDYIGIGNRMVIARARKGIKQHEIGRLLGLSQSSYSQMETGRKEMSINQVFAIAEILEVPVEWLLGLNSDESFTELELLKIEEFKHYIRGNRKKYN